MCGHNGGVAELMRHRRSPSVRRYTRGILPKMVISQSQGNGWFVTPAGLLFLLSFKLSRSGATRKTRQLVRGTDICLAQAESTNSVQSKVRRSKDGQSEISIKGRSFTFHTRSVGRILLKGLSHVVPEQQPNPSPMCHYHSRFT
jgi:hypothetical protein